jgi:hypothetical protein
LEGAGAQAQHCFRGTAHVKCNTMRKMAVHMEVEPTVRSERVEEE